MPAALAERLRVQSAGGAIYLLASAPIEPKNRFMPESPVWRRRLRRERDSAWFAGAESLTRLIDGKTGRIQKIGTTGNRL